MGLRLPLLFDCQGLAHLRVFQEHGGTSSTTGKLLGASIQHLKVKVGTGGPLFQTDFSIFGPLATPSWVSHLWQYLWMKKVGIKESTPLLELQREGNMFLMQHFAMTGTQGAELEKVNRCWLYLQVMSLANISSGDGHLILEDAWKGVLAMFWPAYYMWP